MRIGVIPENVPERLALAAGLVPVPLLESFPTAGLARMLMVSTQLGLFDALEPGARTGAEVARELKTDADATGKLLRALAGAGYLREQRERYALSPLSRRWLVRGKRGSLEDWMRFQLVQWEWMGHFEEYVRTGRPVDLHAVLTPEQWGLYQRSMLTLAQLAAPEVVRRVRLPKGASRLLDLGGSHGYFSVSFCRRAPAMHATVLELAQAIPHAAPLLAREQMGQRVVHVEGNALTTELGEARYDVVFVGQLLHHFDAATNAALLTRLTRATAPGGLVVLYDLVRPSSAREAGQLGGLGDLFFSMMSRSGTWSLEELRGWQLAAGLTAPRSVRLVTVPTLALQLAWKPKA